MKPHNMILGKSLQTGDDNSILEMNDFIVPDVDSMMLIHNGIDQHDVDVVALF